MSGLDEKTKKSLEKLIKKGDWNKLYNFLEKHPDLVIDKLARFLETLGQPAMQLIFNMMMWSKFGTREKQIAGIIIKFMGPSVVDFLIEIIDESIELPPKDTNPSTFLVEMRKVAAVLALGGIPNPRTIPPLIKMLKDQNKYCRLYAAIGLKTNRDEKVIPYLKELLNDPDEEVRKQALLSIEHIKEQNNNNNNNNNIDNSQNDSNNQSTSKNDIKTIDLHLPKEKLAKKLANNPHLLLEYLKMLGDPESLSFLKLMGELKVGTSISMSFHKDPNKKKSGILRLSIPCVKEED